MEELRECIDAVLIDGLPSGLRRAIDRTLLRGVSKECVLLFVRRSAEMAALRMGESSRGRLVTAAVEAYLERK